MNSNKFAAYACLLSAVIFAVVGIFADHSLTLDMHVHDTYFVISLPHTLTAVKLIFLLGWICYYFLPSFFPFKTLTWIQVVITLLMSLVIVGNTLWARRFIDLISVEGFELNNRYMIWAFLGLMSGLLLFIGHFVIGTLLCLFRRFNSPSFNSPL
ncbi:hypothetical protein LX64_04958 [Chitinophaga skermanii]|uniref:Uncharacterized protein n=1 Tax=Chitinophaga skermanii TaxID=331697 RepID=A0A327Q0J5_9BACT|nr:hypothetical protein LX64_04958 [Chitinophaga skermanii]